MSLWQIVGVSVTISDTGDLRSRDLLLILNWGNKGGFHGLTIWCNESLGDARPLIQSGIHGPGPNHLNDIRFEEVKIDLIAVTEPDCKKLNSRTSENFQTSDRIRTGPNKFWTGRSANRAILG